METKNRRKAFTIIEVLVVAAIIVFVLAGIYRLLAGSKKNFIQGGAKLTIQLTGQNLLEYIKTDLMQSCKLRDSAEILRRVGNTYMFYRFNPEIGQLNDARLPGSPVPEKITYIFDPASQTLERREERVSFTSLPAGKSEIIARRVKEFEIIPYTLNTKRYFRIAFRIYMPAGEKSKEIGGTTGEEEEIVMVTSIESRYENNDAENATWWPNRHTKIMDVSGELPIW